VPATCPYPELPQSSPHPIFYLKIHLNIILPSTPGSPQWSLSPCTRLSPPHHRYMSHPSHSSWFYRPLNSGWGVQIIKLLIMKFSPLPCYLVSLMPKYSSQHSILKHPQATFLPQCQRPSFTPIQSTGKIIVLHISTFRFLDSYLEHKRFCTEW
jgi:hypothetical protein